MQRIDHHAISIHRLSVTRHARLRLDERFPEQQKVVVDVCRDFYHKHAGFIGNACYKYRRGNLVAIVKAGRLITVYPHKAEPVSQLTESKHEYGIGYREP